jgi:hypothetical protein
MNRMVGVTGVLACMVAASSCSGGVQASTSAQQHGAYVSRPAPDSHVLLVPDLSGGTAGWCMAMITRTATEGSSACGDPPTSTGPVFAEDCTASEARTDVYALTTSEVAAVSVAGGAPIATAANSTLPNGLRAAAVELVGNKGQSQPGVALPCPRVTPLDANGRPIRRQGERGMPLVLRLPRRHWRRPAHPSRGACQLTATHLPRETVAYRGDVATRIRSFPRLLGRALLSCVDIVYVYREEHHLTSAVLLDASHPGATPPPLPGMKPLAGHPGIFEAPSSEGEVAVRRIPGAWLVVEENDHIGLRVPVELLEHLRATIHL